MIQDADWNVAFSDNCGMPGPGSMSWIEEEGNRYLRFRLNDGDTGRCSSDGKARSHAPYWERAELKQATPLSRNRRYELKFRMRFVEGFAGDRESFWQIHAHTRDCPAKPPVLIRVSGGRLVLYAQRSWGGHETHRSERRIGDLIGKWVEMKLTFDTSDDPTIAWRLDGEELLPRTRFWVEPCGKPHFKFGIYRPGNRAGNARSVADFDRIDLRTAEESR